MEVNVERKTSSQLMQPDLVSSPILRQCLYVIRTVSEFQNLTYRITKTRNDVEVVVVYREGVLGIFGPPVDPISLTFDPKGGCLLTVLFKPLQRVRIVSSDSGQIEIASLLAVLRFIAGKGYLFCPGLPERFLAGKACGKLVVVHGVPFKRFQSSQCPVYYQATTLPQNSHKSSICALCPRCMQAAKLINAQPIFASNAAVTPASLPSQLPILDHFKSEQRNYPVQHPVTKNIITQANDIPAGSILSPAIFSSIHPIGSFNNKTASSDSKQPNLLNSNIIGYQQKAVMDVNGNSQTVVTLKDDNIILDQSTEEKNEGQLVDSKIQALKALLCNLLQEKKKSLDLSPVTKDVPEVKAAKDERKKASDYRAQKGKHPRKNVCRHCKKRYSTPASLLNHLQRHEALSGSWQRRFKERKQLRKPSFSSVMYRMFRGSKAPSLNNKKTHLSEKSLRMFLNYLDELITPQNGAKSLKQQEFNAKNDKKAECKTSEVPHNSQSSQIVLCEQKENDIFAKRFETRRSSRGLSPMQTLLEAAAVADVNQGNVNGTIMPLPLSFTSGVCQEASLVSPTPHLPTVFTEWPEDMVPQKKRRKSSRLASKRAKNNKKRAGGDETHTEMVEVDNAAAAHEQSLLTNLNLLSTVSLETAMRQVPITSQIQTNVSKSIPLTVLSPEGRTATSVFPSTVLSRSQLNDSLSTSKSLTISQQFINNTSGGNMINGTQEACKPLVSATLQTSTSLPPLPPLLFAGSIQGKSFPSPQFQKPQSQVQTVPASTPSPHTSFVTVNTKQAGSVVSIAATSETKTGMNHSPNSDCGAIDLSKPKFNQVKASIPASTEKDIDLSLLSGLPHNIVQLVSGNDNPSEVLHCLMMMSKTPGASILDLQDAKPLSSIISDKQADSDLQARIFASAGNYRIDKGPKSSQQVQSVIASSSRITHSGNGSKPGSVGHEEIQCGYKWSGSGGSVKERTQMVRELVSPDVMASFLRKSIPNVLSQQIKVNLSNAPQHPQQSPQPNQSSMPDWTSQNKGQDTSATDLALNLITSRPTATLVSKGGSLSEALKPASSCVISSSLPAQNWSPATLSSTKTTSILRTSLTNTARIINQITDHHLDSSGNPTTSSPHQLQVKSLSSSQATSSSSLISTAIPSPPSNCSISSPSLAAILRQPAAALHETIQASVLNSSINSSTKPISLAQHNPKDSFSLLSLSSGVKIKTEPVDPHNTEHEVIIMTLPIKAEKQDSSTQKAEGEAGWDQDRSPNNLVMDISPERTVVSRDLGERLKKRAVARSRSQDLANKNNSVKCKH